MSVPITQGTGASSVAAEIISGLNYQQIKVIDGTAASTNVWKVNSDGSAMVSVFGALGVTASISGTVTTTLSGSPSISGAVTVVGTPSISGAVTIVGTPSISGAVTVVGTPSISGAVTIVGTPSISGSVNVPNTVSVAGAVQIAGASPASIATVQRLDIQITGSTLGLVTQGAIHGLTTAGGGAYVEVKVDPSGALVTTASSVVAFQGGTRISSIVSSTPSSVLVGASIFGALPAGNAVIGAVAASISGTVPVIVTGSVLALYAPNASLVSGVTSVLTQTTSVQVLAAAPGAQRNYISQILVTNGSATGTFVDVVDNGQVIYSGYAAASGGGFSASFSPPLRQPTSVLAVYVAPRAQASIIAGMSGYTAS